MGTIRLLAFDEPDHNFIVGIEMRAEKNIGYKVITAVPKVTYKPSCLPGQTPPNPETHKGLWSVVLEDVPDCDRPFWLGWATAMDFCVNNRRLTVACYGRGLCDQ